MTEQELKPAVEPKPLTTTKLLGLPHWLFFSLLSMLLWGVWGLIAKVAVELTSPYQNQVVSTIGLLLALTLFAGSKTLGVGGSKRRGAFWAFVTGLCGGIGNVALYLSFSHGGKASIVVPLSGVYPLVSVVLALVFLREKLNRVQMAGIGLALVALILLNPG
jgi:transporter family protein